MELVFLGTTAAVPTAQRAHPGIALCYRDEVLLWDCGEGTQRQLILAKVNFMRITRVFITHLHGDHFLGLPGLLQTLGFQGRERRLHIYGPPGIEELVERVLSLGEFELEYEIEVERLAPGMRVKGSGYEVEAFEVEHGTPAFGLAFRELKGRRFLREKAEALGIPPGPLYKRLQRGERVVFQGRVVEPEEVLGEEKRGFRVTYSGDTRPVDATAERAGDAVLIHDSTFDAGEAEKARSRMHSTCTEAARVAREGGAKMLFLTHISPRYRDAGVLEAQAREVFPESHVARDLLRVDLLALRKERGWWK